MALTGKGGGSRQPHPGARRHCYRCSLPGLTGFTAYRREGTGGNRHRLIEINMGI